MTSLKKITRKTHVKLWLLQILCRSRKWNHGILCLCANSHYNELAKMHWDHCHVFLFCIHDWNATESLLLVITEMTRHSIQPTNKTPPTKHPPTKHVAASWLNRCTKMHNNVAWLRYNHFVVKSMKHPGTDAKGKASTWMCLHKVCTWFMYTWREFVQSELLPAHEELPKVPTLATTTPVSLSS